MWPKRKPHEQVSDGKNPFSLILKISHNWNICHTTIYGGGSLASRGEHEVVGAIQAEVNLSLR